MEAVRPKQKRKSKDGHSKKISKSIEKEKETFRSEAATSSYREIYLKNSVCDVNEKKTDQISNVTQTPSHKSAEKSDESKLQQADGYRIEDNLAAEINEESVAEEHQSDLFQSTEILLQQEVEKVEETDRHPETFEQIDTSVDEVCDPVLSSQSVVMETAPVETPLTVVQAGVAESIEKDVPQSETPSCPEHLDVSEVYRVTQVKVEQKQIAPKTSSRVVVPRIYPSLQSLSKDVTRDFETIRPFSEEQLLQLYQNSLLESNDIFINNFIQYEKNPEGDRFYELVRTYLRSRSNLVSSHAENKLLQEKTKQQDGLLWEMVDVIITQTGKCLDGKTVSGSHKYIRAKFNDELLSILSQTLQQLREHVQDTLTLHVYTAELSCLQIESYIQSLLSSPSFREIPRNAPVTSFRSHERNANQTNDVLALRRCISVLFSFHRRVVTDRKFVTDVRNWLTMLVAVLLRTAMLEDHLFILNHVLRCPAGVTNWAAHFVQPPTPLPWSEGNTNFSFGSLFLDHALVTLSTLLLPVKAREEFLDHIKVTLSKSYPSPTQLSENLWVVVDSEGEEDEDPSTMWLQWQENDIVALLNQIPVSAVFQHVLSISNSQDSGYYNPERTTEQSMLKILAFSTRLMKLFHEGLKTYCALRYKQLTKRISRLIRHTVQYVSDHWQAFRQCHGHAMDSALVLRLQVEYDQLFLRAVNIIFSSQRLGAWQFMAVLPYKCVSTQMMWRLSWVLHNSYEENQELYSYSEKDWEMKLQDKTVKLLFEEKLAALPESEAFYLLTAFANMASSREQSDVRFVSAVTIEVFEIAFVNRRLRETLSKDGRDLLVTITMKHPFILSILLKKAKKEIEQVGMVTLFLFRELPISLWYPTAEDIDLLSECLLTNALSSPANQLARLILSSMNWDFDAKREQLFLDIEIHRQVALLVIEGFRKFTNMSDAGMLSRSIQQVFLLAQSMRASAALDATEQGFVTWAWDLLLCLRLHLLHGPKPPWVKILLAPEETAADEDCSDFPDLYTDTKLHQLLQGVKQQQPAACYVALTMTSIGHSTELICQKGFELWSDLITKEMYAAATHALFVLLPYFYRDPYSLITNERFLADIQFIILADLTYTALAKSLVVSEFPGKALQQLTAVMLSQIKQAKMYAIEVGGQSTRLWCIMLVKMLDMDKGYFAKWKGTDYVLYMLDQLVKFTSTEPYLLETILLCLARLVKTLPPSTGTTVVSSILSLMSSSYGQHWPSLAPFPTLPSFPWYFWSVLTVETDNHQMECLWNAVQLELVRDFSLTPDAALKKVGAALKLVLPKMEALPLYRWGTQALETEISHPCLPLLWQKFFSLYLQRISSAAEVKVAGSIGYRFFASDAKLALLKRMKRRLNETADYHYQNLQECTATISMLRQDIAGLVDENDEFVIKEKTELLQAMNSKEQNHANLMRLFRSLSFWIEEPRLHDADLHLTDLPSQYEPEKLKAVIENDKRPWLEFVEMDKVNSELANLMVVWVQQRKPTKNKALPKPKDDTSPEGRILKRLGTYDDPVPPPTISPVKQVVPEVPRNISDSMEIFIATVQNSLRIICDQARIFSQRSSKHLGLDCEYLELLPALFRNDVQQISLSLVCNRHVVDGKTCLGPATVVLTFREAHKIENVSSEIERNRTAYSILLSEFAQSPPQSVCSSAVYVENCITALVKQQRKLECQTLREIGVKMFYHIISLMDRHTNQYSPSRQFLTSCLDVLGEEFIHGQEDQCLSLIKVMIGQPSLAGLVAPLFTPLNVTADLYVQLYDYLVSNLCPATASAIFVLLSKFDIGKWLTASKPPLAVCSKLLHSVGQALYNLGMEPEEEMLILLDVTRNHLRVLMLYQFPQHYGDTLHILLKGTGNQSICIQVWDDFLQALNPYPQPDYPSNDSDLSKRWLCQYNVSRTLVSEKILEESLQTVQLFFEQQRLLSREIENCGLYINFAIFTKPLGYFLGMTAHSWIFSKINNGTDSPSTELCTRLWEKIRETFGLWVEPWLKGERLMIPWLEQHSEHASWMFYIYVTCLEYLYGFFAGLPANCVLNLTWKNYVKVYASELVKDNILTMCLHKFTLLPWEAFVPDENDMDLLLEVLEKKKEDSTAFVGSLFSRISWDSNLQHVSATESSATAIKYLVTFASLAMQLAWEPNVQATGSLPQILHKAESFSWFLVRAIEIKDIFRLAVQRCDPVKLLLQGAHNNTGKCVFRLLQSISGMTPCGKQSIGSSTHEETMQKRLLYIRSYVQLTISAAAKPTILSKYKPEFCSVLPQLLELIETVIVADVPPESQLEAGVNLLCEAFQLLGQSSPTELAVNTVTALLTWIPAHTGSLLVLPCISAACKVITFKQHLASVLEVCVESFCISGAGIPPYGGWSHVTPMIHVPEARHEDFLLGCIETSSHLTQHAYLLQQLPTCHHLTQELAFLHRVVDWFAKIKPAQNTEPKAILLWDKIIDLSLRQADFGGDCKAVERALNSFGTTLMSFGEDKIYLGFLGVIGLGNSSPFSLRFRLMCRVLGTFLHLQLPLNGKLRLQPNAAGHIRSLSGGVGKPSQQTLQAVGKLEGLRSNKHYLPVLEIVEWSWNFVMDPNKCLRNGRALLQEFASVFYPDRVYLKIINANV